MLFNNSVFRSYKILERPTELQTMILQGTWLHSMISRYDFYLIFLLVKHHSGFVMCHEYFHNIITFYAFVSLSVYFIYFASSFVIFDLQ